MFSWFKRKRNPDSFLSYWDTGDLMGFKKIDNDDSVQFVDDRSNKIIYFSMLIVSGNNLILPSTHNVEPTITESEGGWQLKGMKKSGTKILVCVISLKNYNDVEWAKNFFNLIAPTPHQN